MCRRLFCLFVVRAKEEEDIRYGTSYTLPSSPPAVREKDKEKEGLLSQFLINACSHSSSSSSDDPLLFVKSLPASPHPSLDPFTYVERRGVLLLPQWLPLPLPPPLKQTFVRSTTSGFDRKEKDGINLSLLRRVKRNCVLGKSQHA